MHFVASGRPTPLFVQFALVCKFSTKLKLRYPLRKRCDLQVTEMVGKPIPVALPIRGPVWAEILQSDVTEELIIGKGIVIIVPVGPSCK